MRQTRYQFGALRVFEAVARHGSVTKAAGELGVTPGAVSQQVRQLEKSLVSMALTDRAIKHAKPGARLKKIADDRGLYLNISPKGKKTWTWRTQTRNQNRWIKIGDYPQMALFQAREKATELWTYGAQGLRSVQSAYDEYLPHLRRSYATHNEIERRFDVDILPTSKTNG